MTVEGLAQVTGVVPASAASVKGVVYRIDATHANAYPLWVSLGMPTYLTPKQVSQLKSASELVAQPLTVDQVSANSVKFHVTIPPNSVVNVVLFLN